MSWHNRFEMAAMQVMKVYSSFIMISSSCTKHSQVYVGKPDFLCVSRMTPLYWPDESTLGNRTQEINNNSPIFYLIILYYFYLMRCIFEKTPTPTRSANDWTKPTHSRVAYVILTYVHPHICFHMPAKLTFHMSSIKILHTCEIVTSYAN